MKRWQIITYDLTEGVDEKLDYGTLPEARRAAREYRHQHNGVTIYDILRRRINRKSGYWPIKALPVEM